MALVLEVCASHPAPTCYQPPAKVIKLTTFSFVQWYSRIEISAPALLYFIGPEGVIKVYSAGYHCGPLVLQFLTHQRPFCRNNRSYLSVSLQHKRLPKQLGPWLGVLCVRSEFLVALVLHHDIQSRFLELILQLGYECSQISYYLFVHYQGKQRIIRLLFDLALSSESKVYLCVAFRGCFPERCQWSGDFCK